jgi:PPOX class probable F420-dependent enzyme
MEDRLLMNPRIRPTHTSTTLSDDDRAFAERHRVAHLATADATGVPHVIPICYALVDEAFYFVIDEKPKRSRNLKRLRNIAANPRVALLIDDYDEDWTRLAYLLVQGRAAQVDSPTEYAAVLAALRARYSQYTAMALAFVTHPMVRITPLRTHRWHAAR